MSKKLFDEFDPVSAKQWKQKIQFDLKGADYNETLIWTSPEGIDVRPFYHSEGLADQLPTSSKKNSWKICQKIFVANEVGANKKAQDVVKRGAESLWFVLPSEEIDFLKLFNEIDLAKIQIHLEPQFLSSSFNLKAKDFFKEQDFFIHNDPIARLAENGNWFENEKDDLLQLSKINTSINTALYQNAGANMVQQLAYSLAHATEYLNNQKITDPSLRFTFKVAVGTNYFFEIAKIRALRWLWNSIASEFGIQNDCHILAFPTKRNKTIYDYNVNMLRTTTECMSAVLGGADTICNLRYDNIYHKDNEFGERIARNQLLILKKESSLDQVSNPSDGAYYIENLTKQLAQKALELFKDIEKGGGFLKLLKEGTIQKKIKEAADKEQLAFDKKEEVLLGTNQHPNKEDRMKDNLELYPFVKNNPRKTIISTILERRLAEKMEQERLKTEAE